MPRVLLMHAFSLNICAMQYTVTNKLLQYILSNFSVLHNCVNKKALYYYCISMFGIFWCCCMFVHTLYVSYEQEYESITGYLGQLDPAL